MAIGKTIKASPLGTGAPSRAFVRWGTLVKILTPLIKAGKISVEGIEMQEIDGGVHLKANPGAAANDHPWKFHRVPGGATGREFRLTTGLINSEPPSNASATHIAAVDGAYYVWAKATLNNNGFVTGSVLEAGTSPPSPNDDWWDAGAAPSAMYLPLLKVTTEGGSIMQTEQVENRNRSVVRNTVFMNCTETKYAVYWS